MSKKRLHAYIRVDSCCIGSIRIDLEQNSTSLSSKRIKNSRYVGSRFVEQQEFETFREIKELKW